jgi:apolipoprotein N-acyltransferase
VGVAVLDRLLRDRPARSRFNRGALAGVPLYLVTFVWMQDFSLPGYVLAVLISAVFLGAAAAAVPLGPDVARWVALPGALTLLEALRLVFPFGGVPLSHLALGQAAGPFGPAARIGTYLLVVLLLGGAGVGLAALVARAWLAAGVALAAVVAVAALAPFAPDGRVEDRLRVAIVQGGGRLGTRAVDTPERVVFERHLDASDRVEGPVDLVLWPEDVVDIEGNVLRTREGRELAALARALDATLIVGVVEGQGDRFRNSVVAFAPDGEAVDRYEKVRRVPFGEYIPFRSLVDKVADLSLIPREALVGEGPGHVDTPAGEFGVVISFELFFIDRARSGIEAGGAVLLAPTNSSSYRLSLVASQAVASSRLRALETGRWTLLAAPTGFSAVIDEDGRVLQRTGQREQAVLEATVEQRSGHTLATRIGRLPVIGLAALLLVLAYLTPRIRG